MDNENPVLIPAAKVRQRYGGRSHMWIERRLRDNSGFPAPIYIGRLRFWRLADLEEYERSLVTKGGAA